MQQETFGHIFCALQVGFAERIRRVPEQEQIVAGNLSLGWAANISVSSISVIAVSFVPRGATCSCLVVVFLGRVAGGV